MKRSEDENSLVDGKRKQGALEDVTEDSTEQEDGLGGIESAFDRVTSVADALISSIMDESQERKNSTTMMMSDHSLGSKADSSNLSYSEMDCSLDDWSMKKEIRSLKRASHDLQRELADAGRNDPLLGRQTSANTLLSSTESITELAVTTPVMSNVMVGHKKQGGGVPRRIATSSTTSTVIPKKRQLLPGLGLISWKYTIILAVFAILIWSFLARLVYEVSVGRTLDGEGRLESPLQTFKTILIGYKIFL